MATLGIDTSCYTTSVAVVESGAVYLDLRNKLEVEDGGLGLRQSEAFYRHSRSLPAMIAEAFTKARAEGLLVDKVAASCFPRRAEGSFMPVFTAGAGYARAIASAAGVSLAEVSHQEGHIAACATDAGLGPGDKFLAAHVSGGTTEVLEVVWGDDAMDIKIHAASSDLAAGQMIDRIGRFLGLPFPAGPALEQIACLDMDEGFRIPSFVKDGKISFSGPCEAALRGLRAGEEPSAVAKATFDCIAKSLASAIGEASGAIGIKTALVVGGVAANARIREKLVGRLSRAGVETLFGSVGLSSDNAVGVAFLGELWT